MIVEFRIRRGPLGIYQQSKALSIIILALAIFPESALCQTAQEALIAQSAEFRKEVVAVTDGVYCAVGFALANSIMIDGEDGIVIVDTTESPVSAREILTEFRKITDKPVKAIIYTHFHADHIRGANVFAGRDKPTVIAHESTQANVNDNYELLQTIRYSRGLKQLGSRLSEEDYINSGLGPRMVVGLQDGYIPPDKTFTDTMDLEISGIKMQLFHAPGETSDQIFVWLPESKTLLPGDNFYKAFPNLYAIRGTKYRDVRVWADSLQLMIDLEPEHLVPSHTRPITGAEEIKTRLSNYRDAIDFVHDKTVEGINKGLSGNALVASVKLPDHLKSDPWLQEFYGTVAWSVRGIYSGYMGWFDGNPTNLEPLDDADRAARYMKLVGGREKFLAAAREAAAAGDHEWVCELADHLLALDEQDGDARQLKAKSLRVLGRAHPSANGRNYKLTVADELLSGQGSPKGE